MKRFVFAVSLLALQSASVVRADGAKPRVAVLEFKNKASNYSWNWYDAGRGAQDMLVTELVKSGKYRVIEREQLAAIMLSIPGGQLADRYNRLRVMTASFSLGVLSAAGLLAVGEILPGGIACGPGISGCSFE